jgi:uncharacterized membrane protein HdeD (DUF308 family)
VASESAHMKGSPFDEAAGAAGIGRLPHQVVETISQFWWIELILGALWLVASLVILKFNHASVTTVGVLIGILFLAFSVEYFVLASLDQRATRWLWAFFAVLLAAGGIVSLIHPRETFAGFADILGFVFLVVGVLWTVQAFSERVFNSLWWLTLISGILAIILAFWTSGAFFVERAYTLLIFAGIWALAKGITDIVRAFQLRNLHTE